MDILELNQKISEEIRAIVSMFGNISITEFNVKVDNEKIHISYKNEFEESECEKDDYGKRIRTRKLKFYKV